MTHRIVKLNEFPILCIGCDRRNKVILSYEATTKSYFPKEVNCSFCSTCTPITLLPVVNKAKK